MTRKKFSGDVEQLGGGRSPKADRDSANGFVDALSSAASPLAPMRELEQIPSLYPTPERLQDRDPSLPTDPPAESLAKSFSYELKFKRFNTDDQSDLAEYEKVMGHILNDGWLREREEWVNTREGSTYILLSYIVPKPRDAKDKS